MPFYIISNCGTSGTCDLVSTKPCIVIEMSLQISIAHRYLRKDYFVVRSSGVKLFERFTLFPYLEGKLEIAQYTELCMSTDRWHAAFSTMSALKVYIHRGVCMRLALLNFYWQILSFSMWKILRNIFNPRFGHLNTHTNFLFEMLSLIQPI